MYKPGDIITHKDWPKDWTFTIIKINADVYNGICNWDGCSGSITLTNNYILIKQHNPWKNTELKSGGNL